MKKYLYLLFFFISNSIHAQWIMNPGYMQPLYIDPVLMKDKQISEFIIVSDVHDSGPRDKEFKFFSFYMKRNYWVNKEGFVFGSGDRYGKDTAMYDHFAPIPGNPRVWTMIEDSMKIISNRVYLYNGNELFDRCTTFDTLGRLISYRSSNKNNDGRYLDSHLKYHYADNHLDHITSSRSFPYHGCQIHL